MKFWNKLKHNFLKFMEKLKLEIRALLILFYYLGTYAFFVNKKDNKYDRPLRGPILVAI